MDINNEEKVIENFHELFYTKAEQGGTWSGIRWMGIPTRKNPFDIWIYQEIIHEIRPDAIVECGTMLGGSALFFVQMCDLVGKGRIITVDIEKREKRPDHPRINYLTGSSTDPEIIARVQSLIRPSEVIMVVLDSDHHKDHVFQEMRLYSPLVTVGSYLVVEDGNINGHPVLSSFGPGPAEAIEKFLSSSVDFVVDKAREKLLMTFNPGGYLKRVR